jgi:hypothetical protein
MALAAINSPTLMHMAFGTWGNEQINTDDHENNANLLFYVRISV